MSLRASHGPQGNGSAIRVRFDVTGSSADRDEADHSRPHGMHPRVMADPRAPINECLGSAALSVIGALRSVYLCAHVLVATLNPAFFFARHHSRHRYGGTVAHLSHRGINSEVEMKDDLTTTHAHTSDDSAIDRGRRGLAGVLALLGGGALMTGCDSEPSPRLLPWIPAV